MAAASNVPAGSGVPATSRLGHGEAQAHLEMPCPTSGFGHGEGFAMNTCMQLLWGLAGGLGGSWRVRVSVKCRVGFKGLMGRSQRRKLHVLNHECMLGVSVGLMQLLHSEMARCAMSPAASLPSIQSLVSTSTTVHGDVAPLMHGVSGVPIDTVGSCPPSASLSLALSSPLSSQGLPPGLPWQGLTPGLPWQGLPPGLPWQGLPPGLPWQGLPPGLPWQGLPLGLDSCMHGPGACSLGDWGCECCPRSSPAS